MTLPSSLLAILAASCASTPAVQSVTPVQTDAPTAQAPVDPAPDVGSPEALLERAEALHRDEQFCEEAEVLRDVIRLRGEGNASAVEAERLSHAEQNCDAQVRETLQRVHGDDCPACGMG